MSEIVTAKQVELYTKNKLNKLLLQSGDNVLRAALAELRRGVGKKPGDIPQLWGYFLQDMPEELFGTNEPSKAEWAIYTTLTLFALHQQGKDPKTDCMYKEGYSFGTAVNRLVHDEDERERVARRFYAVATASSMEELSHHMRGIIQLLRGEGIPIDYPMLAADLYRYQFNSLVSNVRLKWGQDFYRITITEEKE